MIPALLDVQQTMLRLMLYAIVSLFTHITPLIPILTIGSNYKTTHCQQCPDNLTQAGERLHWLLAETVTLLMMMFINY